MPYLAFQKNDIAEGTVTDVALAIKMSYFRKKTHSYYTHQNKELYYKANTRNLI